MAGSCSCEAMAGEGPSSVVLGGGRWARSWREEGGAVRWLLLSVRTGKGGGWWPPHGDCAPGAGSGGGQLVTVRATGRHGVGDWG